MKYQLLVFDWDGTLYDSSELIVKCVQKAAVAIGLSIPQAETIKQFIGLSVDEALSHGFPGLTPMKKANLIKAYREFLVTEAEIPTLFTGVKETLVKLKEQGYLLTIATSKDSNYLKKDLEILDLKNTFFMTQSADQAASKPNPAMLYNILYQTGMVVEQTLMIGDTEYDMQMAANAQIDGLGVSYGAHDTKRLQLPNVKHIINNITELPVWLATT
ncbi:MAG: hypothetical protein A3E87_03460 [Gammaproteobacteria bacterium RIFCSPHIGHO2_12_FULL_35_23]|nr:MAG: hypothetical protein A3E87_03460 [Gammaproteobacteria bacterium RIFCSPHIGHO2_12_FULL_35_23]